MNSEPEHYLLASIKGEANVGLRVKVEGAYLDFQREKSVKEVISTLIGNPGYLLTFNDIEICLYVNS